MDQAARQHKQAAGQEAEVDPLPADAGQGAAKQRLLQHLFHAVAAAQAGFEAVERRGLADAVHAHLQFVQRRALRGMAAENGQQRVVERQRGGTQLIRRQPAGHLYREGDQQHHVTDHCRVERVLPEAAVQLLGDDDGEESTDDDHPPGASGGRLMPSSSAVSRAELSASRLRTGSLRSLRIAPSAASATIAASAT